MTESQREAIATLSEICTLSPEVRLGQLMTHLDLLAESHLKKRLGDIEDDELTAILYRHRAELKARRQGLPGIENSATTSVSGSSTEPSSHS